MQYHICVGRWMGANCARACRFCQNIDDAVPLDTPHYSCHDIDTKCHIRRLNGQCEEYLE